MATICHSMDIPIFFIHQLMGSYFHYLAVKYYAAVTIHVLIFVYTCVFMSLAYTWEWDRATEFYSSLL